jgi:hypothetical protein
MHFRSEDAAILAKNIRPGGFVISKYAYSLRAIYPATQIRYKWLARD